VDTCSAIPLYFSSLAPWTAHFPFVNDIVVPPLPAGTAAVDRPFGILSHALHPACAGARWPGVGRADGGPTSVVCRRPPAAVASGALVLGLFYGTCTRYQVEFHPALVLLACLGAFGLAAPPVALSAARTACLVGGVGALLYSRRSAS